MAILFDFDGTLADTLPDLLTVVNQLLQQRNLPLVTAAEIRPLISAGSRAILEKFLPADLQTQAETIRQELLQKYVAANYPKTELFPGIRELLTKLQKHQIPWGIVTNRLSSLTKPLIEKFALTTQPQCLLGCDHVTNPKPHPEPLLLASKQLNIKPENCIYIGDAESDMIAGKGAGMCTMVAMFGYIPNKIVAMSWQADFYVHKVENIFPLVLEWHLKRKLLQMKNNV